MSLKGIVDICTFLVGINGLLLTSYLGDGNGGFLTLIRQLSPPCFGGESIA